MRWQFTCVGSSLGSLAADAHVGGGRVLSLRRGALAARREDEESSLGCLVSAPLVFVGYCVGLDSYGFGRKKT